MIKMYRNMTWAIEWKQYLQERADADEQKELAAGKTYIPFIRESLQAHCNKDGLIYQPAMYDEYLTWEVKHEARIKEAHNVSPLERITIFSRVSSTMFQQLDELQVMGNYEQYVNKLYYSPVSILERMSLAAAYARS
jgi:hypothetical protein